MTWILQLNDMRSPKSEHLSPVCRADTAEQLVELLTRERVEHYQTPKDPTFGIAWNKAFRQGGPLEWFNPPYDDTLVYLIREGLLVEVDVEARVASYRRSLERELAHIPHIGLVVDGEEVPARALAAPQL